MYISIICFWSLALIIELFGKNAFGCLVVFGVEEMLGHTIVRIHFGGVS